MARLEAKLATKQALLDEAVIEFHNKNGALLRSAQAGGGLRARCARLDDEVADLRVQLDKCNLLLSDANVRLDAREEELSSTEEQLLKVSRVESSFPQNEVDNCVSIILNLSFRMFYEKPRV